jgi:hypothetical protein
VAGRAKQNELNSGARSGAFTLAADLAVSLGKKLTVAGDQKFESISLQRRVRRNLRETSGDGGRRQVSMPITASATQFIC